MWMLSYCVKFTWQLKDMELLLDDDKTSIITFAVLSKNATMFEAALAGVDKVLSPQEVGNKRGDDTNRCLEEYDFHQ